ncbi:hypothetical protein [Bacillus velezensis]|uniref:hypothetical protein n=1 Tax=Bacillus velezensis TaxID=492670 RepID=UPI002FBE61DC
MKNVNQTVTTPVCTTQEERLWKPEKSAQARRDEIVEAAKLGERLGKTDELIGKIEFLVEELSRGGCHIWMYKQRERIEQLAQQLSELI